MRHRDLRGFFQPRRSSRVHRTHIRPVPGRTPAPCISHGLHPWLFTFHPFGIAPTRQICIKQQTQSPSMRTSPTCDHLNSPLRGVPKGRGWSFRQAQTPQIAASTVETHGRASLQSHIHTSAQIPASISSANVCGWLMYLPQCTTHPLTDTAAIPLLEGCP